MNSTRQISTRAVLVAQLLLLLAAAGSVVALVDHDFHRWRLWGTYVDLFHGADVLLCLLAFLGLGAGRRWGIVLALAELAVSAFLNGRGVVESWLHADGVPLHSGEILATVLCLLYAATGVWLSLKTSLAPFELQRFDFLSRPVNCFFTGVVGFFDRHLWKLGVGLVVVVVGFVAVDAYVMPGVNYERVKTGENPILIISSGFFWDGGTTLDEGMTYAIRDSRHNTFKRQLDLPTGLDVVYFCDLPFRDEMVFARHVTDGIEFSDDKTQESAVPASK